MPMIKQICLLTLFIFLVLPGISRAGQVILGNTVIQVTTPENFFEDSVFFEAIKPSLPSSLLAHKMYIPEEGVRTSENKRSLLDYVLITSAKDATNNDVTPDNLAELEKIRDERYAVAKSFERCYSRQENRETLNKLQANPNKDGIFLEKDVKNGAISYITLVHANQKDRYMVSSTTFLIVNKRLLTIGTFSRVRGRAIYNSVKIVRGMTQKLISMLQTNN